MAEADGFIAELPQGYDTVVGERGLTLSGGQRQRIALARAVLSDPRILILDDATSAVDAVTEEAINRTLRQVMRGRTTLLVAHRRSTLHLADRVVVIDGGRVVAQGTHDRLLETNALYRSLLTGLADDDVRLVDQPADQRRWRPAAGGAGAAVSRASPARRFAARANGAASIGGGLGGGGGGWRNGLAPTPDLIERVDRPAPGARCGRRRSRRRGRARTRSSRCFGSCAASGARCCSGWCSSSSTRWPRWPARCW